MSSSPNPYAPPAARVADVESVQASPPLWNPGAAASWSLLFSPAFGALVQMKNWEALGEPGRALRSRNWAIASVAFFSVMTVVTMLLPDVKSMEALNRTFAIALLIGWYYADGKSQQTHVLGKFGKAYPRRGWGKPLLLGVGGMFAFMLVMGVFGFVIGMLMGVY
jgi:hypothetical protein